MSVGREGVALRHAVIDEHGRVERGRSGDRRVERGVFVFADGDAHPVEDVTALPRRALVEHARAGAHVVREERENR